jgi:uncharacterized membrane protein
MPRGQAAEVGSETIAQNGYTWVRVEGGWKYKHVLIAEEKLGRPLEADERVSFKDHNRTNFDPNNIVVSTFTKKIPSLSSLNKIRNRVDKVEQRFNEELQQVRTAIDELESEISIEAL